MLIKLDNKNKDKRINNLQINKMIRKLYGLCNKLKRNNMVIIT